jgi:hypothetical protein
MHKVLSRIFSKSVTFWIVQAIRRAVTQFRAQTADAELFILDYVTTPFSIKGYIELNG